MSSVVSIRTDSALLSQFTSLAEATGRTRSFLINQAMREFVERESWQVAAIQKAVQEADAGDFATSDEVAAMEMQSGAIMRIRWLRAILRDLQASPTLCGGGC